MGPVPCEECGRNMSAAAVVCPHCGTRQAERDPIDAGAEEKKAGLKNKPLSLSKEETAALLMTKGASGSTYEFERPKGPMVLLLPRVESTGLVRTLEWALTIVSLPLFFFGLLAVVFRPRIWRWVANGNELGLSLFSGLMGGISIWAMGGFAGWSDNTVWGAIGVCTGALVARMILRALPARER